jgi:aspartyl-tRNA(Asn)/glutamyl-tRNA(Gln) amidotransferase subunit C
MTQSTTLIDTTVVKRVAKLAHIRMQQDELQPVADKLNGIMAWIEQLNEVDIEGVAPMTSAVAMTQRLRADVVTDGGKAPAVVANAPKTDANFFIVPKVVE